MLREINPDYSLEGLVMKLKLQYFGHLMWPDTHWKSPWCWERLRTEGEVCLRVWDGWTVSPMQSIWTWVNLGDGGGQEGLACCSSWGCKELDMNNNSNPLPKPDNDNTRKQRYRSISPEHNCKSPQQNISKYSPTMYKQNWIPWPSVIDSRYLSWLNVWKSIILTS